MLGDILIAIILSIFHIVLLPYALLLAIIANFNPKLASSGAHKVVDFTCRLILIASGSKVEVKGRENIPEHEPVLFVSNHRSLLDIATALGYMRKESGFVAKKSLSKIPIFSEWMNLIGCVYLDRTNLKQEMKSMLEAIKRVKDGWSIWICPEGTRNESKDATDVAEFKEGSMKIAQKSGCMVIPVALTGTSEIFEQHIPFVRKSHVTMEFGKGFFISELPEEFKNRSAQYAREIIIQMLIDEKERRKSGQ